MILFSWKKQSAIIKKSPKFYHILSKLVKVKGKKARNGVGQRMVWLRMCSACILLLFYLFNFSRNFNSKKVKRAPHFVIHLPSCFISKQLFFQFQCHHKSINIFYFGQKDNTRSAKVVTSHRTYSRGYAFYS